MSGLAIAGGIAKVSGMAKAIPPKVWYAIGIILALVAAFIFHQRAAHKAIHNADIAGYTRAMKEVEARALELSKKAKLLSDNARKLNDAANTRIHSSATIIRLSGPGKAVCPRVSATAGRSNQAGSGGNVTGPQVPPDNLAAVPWDWLVTRAEEHDLCRAEALSWRDWYKSQAELWKGK